MISSIFIASSDTGYQFRIPLVTNVVKESVSNKAR